MGVARPIRETIVLGMKAEWIGKMDQVHASKIQYKYGYKIIIVKYLQTILINSSEGLRNKLTVIF
jgi:hypothetical protein